MLNKREYKAKIKEYEELVAQREQHPDKPNQIQSEWNDNNYLNMCEASSQHQDRSTRPVLRAIDYFDNW